MSWWLGVGPAPADLAAPGVSGAFIACAAAAAMPDTAAAGFNTSTITRARLTEPRQEETQWRKRLET